MHVKKYELAIKKNYKEKNKILFIYLLVGLLQPKCSHVKLPN